MKARNHNIAAIRLTLFMSLAILLSSLSALAVGNGPGGWSEPPENLAGSSQGKMGPAQKRVALWSCRAEPFKQDSYAVSGDQAKCLDESVIYLKRYSESLLIIEGHHNQEEKAGISRLRAESARDYLVNEKGVDADRIMVRDFCDNCRIDYKETWRNSRIELGIVPKSADISPTRFTIGKCLNPSAERCN